MKAKVLVVERHPASRAALAGALRASGFDCAPHACWEEARRVAASVEAICLGELGESGADSIEILRKMRGTGIMAPALMWLPERTEQLVLSAMRAGATDYFKQDEPLGGVVAAVAAAVRTKVARPRRIGEPVEDVTRMVGDSAAICELRDMLPKLAASDCNVLITGETGTGKDLAAELIHRNSRRSKGPFVCINCAAFPDTLLESELFGYDRGAFTGASAPHPGKLEFAHSGTIFLDEIGEMSPYAQAKILRALESREIQRLGSNGSIPIDVRIIAATNQNLATMVAEKVFRSDLFFRLNVARLHLPPLRERKQDIPLLLSHYVGELNRRMGSAVENCTGETMERLMRYDWPGNVRELKNLLEAVFITPPPGSIAPRDLPEWFRSAQIPENPVRTSDLERLMEALNSSQWNKTKAAAKLRWSRMTLYRKMTKYGIPSGQRVLNATGAPF